MIENITVRQAYELLAAGELDIVDVREPHEWTTGHIPGARLVPLGRLRAAPKASLPRDGVIFVCAAGVRSETAARVALAAGLTRIYNLSGGTRAWIAAGLAVEHEPLRRAVG